MSDWTEQTDLTEPKEGDNLPRSSVFGRMRKGDDVVLEFHDNGDLVEREHGNATVFEVTLEEASFMPLTWSDEEIEEGELFLFETTSSAFLQHITQLAAQNELAGATIRATRNYEGAGDPQDYWTVQIVDA